MLRTSLLRQTRVPASRLGRYQLYRLYSDAAAAAAAAPKKHHDQDVVIIGGGPAGLTLAASLKASPVTSHLSVALVEGSDLGKIKAWELGEDAYENRVSSLTPRSKKCLETIGVWDKMKTERIKDYDEMKVWDGVSGARIEFDPTFLGENAEIAFMCENFNLQQGLLKFLEDKDIKIIDKSRVKTIESSSGELNWPLVQLEDGTSLSARLLVGADGANSPVRTFAGIESRGWDYNTHGLVASLELEWEDFRNVAWQRFLPTGPIAMLPMPNGFASLVWSTTPERAAHLKTLSSEDFSAMVNAGFRLTPADLDYLHTLTEGVADEVQWRLSNTVIEDEDNTCPVPVLRVLDKTRASFPLKMKHADTYVSDRVALVGDAAHTTHPLAGQGLNMGQSDIAHLSKAIETAVLRGQDIGSLLALEPYWKASYLPNHMKLGVVDKLHKLYSTGSYPVVGLRSFGLNLVNSSEWIKKLLMAQASN